MTAPTRSLTLREPQPATRRTLGAIGRQARVFALVGIASTLAYTGLYAILRTGAPAASANAIALAVTAIGNTAANRRLTFGVRGRASLLRDHLAGLSAFVIALAITTGAIALLAAAAPAADRSIEVGVLLVANVVGTVVRFALLRSWVARDRATTPTSPSPGRSPS